ncbi:MAG: hypothetical protein V1922_02970 [bacterium]
MALRELRSTNENDVPATPTSSVGEVVYPPVAASERRKKGIFPSAISLPGDLMQLTGEFGDLPLGGETSRVSVRYFVENEMLTHLLPAERAQIAPYLEGVVRLAGDGTMFNDCSIIYLGKNSDDRRTRQDVVDAELQMAQRVFGSPVARTEHDYAGFTFREITAEDKVDPAVIDQYAELYKAFGWTRDEVIKILQHPTNILLGGFVGDQLVSAGMAERAQFCIERNGAPHPFVMYEITEAATRSEYRGKGLYTKVATELMRLLACTDIDLLYGESNLLSEPVIRAAHSLGRTSSLETLEEFGFPPRFLEQHVRISGGKNDTRPPEEKNDLLPTYMTRNKLLQYAHE